MWCFPVNPSSEMGLRQCTGLGRCGGRGFTAERKEVMKEQGGDEICPSAASPEQTGRRRPACPLLHYGCGPAEGTVCCRAKITAGQSKVPPAAPGVGMGHSWGSAEGRRSRTLLAETWPHAVGKEGSHLPPRERCLSAQRAGRRVREEQWGQRGCFTSFFTQGAVAVARGQTSAPCASPACDLPACCVQKS